MTTLDRNSAKSADEERINEMAEFIEGGEVEEDNASIREWLGDSPENREVFAATVDFMEADRRATFMRRVKRASAPLAAAALLVLTIPFWPRTPEMPSTARFVVNVVRNDSELIQVSASWYLNPQPTMRGGDRAVAEPPTIFRLGAKHIDLATALRLNDSEVARLSISQIVTLLEGVEFSDDIREQYRMFADRIGEGRVAAREEAEQLERALERFLLGSPHFALGRWAESSRLALLIANDDFFQGDVGVAALASMKSLELDSLTILDIDRIDAITAEGITQDEWDLLNVVIDGIFGRY